jgi:hypothetical protein
LTFKVAGDAAGVQGELALHGLQLPQVKTFLAAQKLPVPDLEYAGNADLDMQVARQGDRFTADVKLLITDGGYQNADFTLIGEKLAATVQATVNLASTPITFEAHVASTKGHSERHLLAESRANHEVPQRATWTCSPHWQRTSCPRALRRKGSIDRCRRCALSGGLLELHAAGAGHHAFQPA